MKPSTKAGEKRDKYLFRTLLVLNFVSGSTTIRGALQVLPVAVGLPAGLIIQTLLLLLLSGSTASHAPKRKWIAVLVLSLLSAYTSFFAYFAQLTDDQQTELSLDQARTAHQELITNVYTPLKQELSLLHQEYIEAQRSTEEEAKNGLFSGNGSGFGDKARELKQRELKKQAEYKKIEALLSELKPRFEYSLENLTPEQIYSKDQSALAEVPHSLRSGDFDIERADYLDPSLDIALLTPYYKIQEGKSEAIVAMGLALTLDSLIIMLGTAIIIVERSKSKAIWEIAAGFIAGQMSGVKGFRKTLVQEAQKPAAVYTKVLDLEQLGIPLMIIRELRGKCSAFLLQLYKATHPSTRVINFEQLKKQTGEAILVYRMLLDNLMSPGLGWVYCNDDDVWIVNQHHYYEYTQWLQKEIARHIEIERTCLDAKYSPAPVTIEIPTASTK